MDFDFEQMKKVVVDWLNEEGIIMQVKASEKDHFLITVKYPSGSNSNILLFAPNSKKDVVCVEAIIKIDNPKYAEIFRKMKKKKLTDFIYRFKKSFYLVPPRVNLINDKENKIPLKVQILKNIWVDDVLKKSQLMQTMDEVSQIREAARYYILHEFHINSPEPSQDKKLKSSADTTSYIR